MSEVEQAAEEWAVLVTVGCSSDHWIIHSDETSELEGETPLTEETAWAIASALDIVSLSLVGLDGSPLIAAAVFHRGNRVDQRPGRPDSGNRCCCAGGGDWDCYACVSGNHHGCPEYEAPAAQDAVGVGSLSPTEAAELGAWLRGLPLRTILSDRTWNPCQRETGVEHRHRAPNREFPALFIHGAPFDITEGHPQVDELARYAPFKILALGGDGVEDGASAATLDRHLPCGE
jgi:hypothetical protein